MEGEKDPPPVHPMGSLMDLAGSRLGPAWRILHLLTVRLGHRGTLQGESAASRQWALSLKGAGLLVLQQRAGKGEVRPGERQRMLRIP